MICETLPHLILSTNFNSISFSEGWSKGTRSTLFYTLVHQSLESRGIGSCFLKTVIKLIKTKYSLVTSALKKTSAFQCNVPMKRTWCLKLALRNIKRHNSVVILPLEISISWLNNQTQDLFFFNANKCWGKPPPRECSKANNSSVQ